MKIKKLFKSDGSWDQFCIDWEQQCNEIDDDYNNYAQYLLQTIKEFAIAENEGEWAYAVQIDNKFTAAFVIILANQKGYIGQTLRVRHMVACPLLDFGTLDEDAYIQTLVEILFGAVKLSETLYDVKNIKMQARSPLDLKYLKVFASVLDRKDIFKSTVLQGSWLTLNIA